MARFLAKLLLFIATGLGIGPAAVLADPGSIELFYNETGSQNQDHILQTDIPAGFGSGEFTLELWIRPNNSFPIGTVLGGEEQRRNWAIDDNQPYTGNWWFKGNFLLDGHNNGSGFSLGTFSLQFYGGGRVRWLLGDGSGSIPTGGLWSVGAYPASSTTSLLDGSWHQLTLVRRWSGPSDALLEMWIDGSLVDTETSNSRANMRQWWDNWNGFPNGQEGWFWGAEKQAVVGILSQYEDYKGLIDEIRFWSRAKVAGEIASDFASPVVGTEPGLVARYAFGEATATSICDTIDTSRCMVLGNSSAAAWSASGAPVTPGGDITPPTTPTNLQGQAQSTTEVSLNWTDSTDNVAVTEYVVRRDGAIVDVTPITSFDDSGLLPNTTYEYTVAARDAAGNESAPSANVNVTTLAAPDTQVPSVPGNLQGTAISPNRMDLTWNASSDNVGVSGYEVRRDGVLIASPAGTTHGDTGLTANTAYVYTVAARDAAGNTSAESGAIMVSTLASPDTEAPSTPAVLQGSSASTTSVSLNWSASTDNVSVASYEVLRNGIAVGTTPTTAFLDNDLSPANTYSYAVVAIDDAGNRSALAASVGVTTDSGPPPTASKSGGGSLGWPGLFILLIIAAYRRRL